jgi:hypothetical protein
VKIANDTYFDPETITLLRRVLDDAMVALAARPDEGQPLNVGRTHSESGEPGRT